MIRLMMITTCVTIHLDIIISIVIIIIIICSSSIYKVPGGVRAALLRRPALRALRPPAALNTYFTTMILLAVAFD